MQITLGLLHGADYLVAHLFLGLAVFVWGVAPVGGSSARELLGTHHRWLRILVALTFLTSFLWMVFSSADMADGWEWNGLLQAMAETRFGHLWCLRTLLLLFLALAWGKLEKIRPAWMLLLLFALPIVSSLTGHAGSREGSLFLPVAVDVLHSLAVATWAGGLLGLYLWLGERLRSLAEASDVSHRVVTRFSHLAIASTCVIGGTGLYMAYRAGIDPWHPFRTSYGTLLMLKIILFFSALAAASINQFVHLRLTKDAGEKKFAASIRREVRAEIILIILIFALAGFLARTDLPLGLSI